jgi:hypothetical protein
MNSTINDYVLAFLEEHGSEEMVDAWNEKKNQDDLKTMIKDNVKTTKTTKTKDLNAPKKSKSAYLFFCADKREEAKEQADDHKQILSILGGMWSELKEKAEGGDKEAKKDLEKYNKMSEDDKKRYKEEMDDYEPPADTGSDDDKPKGKKGKGKAKSDKPKTKRAKSAYLFFCADNREEVNKSFSGKEILTELGRLWSELKETDPDAHQKYVDLAAEEKAKLTESDSDKASDKATDDDDDDDDKPKKSKKTKAPKKVAPPPSDDDNEDGHEEKEEEPKPKDKKSSGYKVFYKSVKDQVKKDNKGKSVAEMTKIIADMWKKMSAEEKEEWKNKA